MSAPAPGRVPTTVPSTLPRRVCAEYLRDQRPHAREDLADLLGRSPMRAVVDARSAAPRRRRTGRSWPGSGSRPPSRSALPKVKRGCAAGFSSPTLPSSRPSSSVTKPLSGRSLAMKTAQVRPSSTSQKYSNELNLSATSASAGAATISTSGAEQAADAPRTPGRCRARSRPGPCASWRRSRRHRRPRPACPGCAAAQPGMSPAKIAMAVAVTIAAIAGDRRQEEGDRHQQRGRHGRRQARARRRRTGRTAPSRGSSGARSASNDQLRRPAARRPSSSTRRSGCSRPQGSGTVSSL